MYEQFFPNLFFFSKMNNAKMISLIIFHITIIIFITLKSNFTKERRM